MKSKVLLAVMFIALLAGNIFFGLSYLAKQKELEGTQIVISTQRYNAMMLNFAKMFIKRVLKADKEVDFETRLKLENAVRDLKDDQVLQLWQQFVNSKDEVEAQKNVKDLLDTIMDKVYIR